jgi:NAD/NADP transhydrogenase alpha subunit
MTTSMPIDPERVAQPQKLPTSLLLRSELGKALEHRSALTPTTTKKLIEAGYHVKVERSPQRIFDDEEFEKAGATLVEENTWRDAPKDTIIIGLKELPVEKCEQIAAENIRLSLADTCKSL